MTRGRRITLIPAALARVEWPTPGETTLNNLSEAALQRYRRREQAVNLVRADTPFDVIRQSTGFSRSEVRRLVLKCLAVAEDGSIAGYRALLHNSFRKPYERTKPVVFQGRKVRGGAAGAWGQLLKTIPSLEETIEDLVFPANECDGARPPHIEEIWGGFLRALREAGLTNDDYPFCFVEQGMRSLREHVRKLEEQNPRRTVRLRGGKTAALRWDAISVTKKRLIGPLRPGAYAILDYHLVDARTIVIVQSSTGEDHHIVVPRWYIGVLVDEHLGAILGVTATLEVNPSASDALQALDCMIHPKRYIDADLNGLELADDKIFIQQMVPEHADASISVLRVDNAWANAANAVIRNTVYTFGACVQFGRSRFWMGRHIVERVIKEIATRGPQRAPSSTGASPTSGLHSDAGERAKEHLVTIEQLMKIILNVVREYNATRTERLAYSDATFVLDRAYRDADSPIPGMRLPQKTISNGTLLHETFICRVVGNVKKGVRPYINWKGRYSNSELERRPDLIGKKLICSVPHYDCNVMYAVIEETHVSLGRLAPAKPYTPPCSIRYRNYLRGEGRGKQISQRARTAEARAAEKEQAENRPRAKAPKDALRDARVEQDARRFPPESQTPHKAAPHRVVPSANDELKGWGGTPDPFGLAVVKRRRPA